MLFSALLWNVPLWSFPDHLSLFFLALLILPAVIAALIALALFFRKESIFFELRQFGKVLILGQVLSVVVFGALDFAAGFAHRTFFLRYIFAFYWFVESMAIGWGLMLGWQKIRRDTQFYRRALIYGSILGLAPLSLTSMVLKAAKSIEPWGWNILGLLAWPLGNSIAVALLAVRVKNRANRFNGSLKIRR